jgi:hypothetical protein
MGMQQHRELLAAATCALCLLWAGPAAASDASEVTATVDKWVADFNKGDMQPFLAACAPKVSVIDGFPPFAWPTCAEWINGYHANSKAIQLTDGRLWIGKPVYSEVTAEHAYLIYPARFSDLEKGKPVVYRGAWTMTLQKAGGRWLFTGSSSAWTGH